MLCYIGIRFMVLVFMFEYLTPEKFIWCKTDIWQAYEDLKRFSVYRGDNSYDNHLNLFSIPDRKSCAHKNFKASFLNFCSFWRCTSPLYNVSCNCKSWF